MKKYILSLLVQNNFGVLARISSLFARRGYNIHSLTVSPTNNPKVSKITVVVMGDDEVVKKVLKQVSKLEETVKVLQFEEESALCKELVLIKLATKDNDACCKVSQVAEQFQAKILKISLNSVTLELTDVPSKVDSFVYTLNGMEITEMCRTGVTALES